MAVCILTLSEYNSHTEPLFKKVEILSLPTLIEYFKLQFMHRFVVNWLPRSFESTWSRNAERRLDPNRVVLQNNEDLFIPPYTENFSLFSFPRLWGSFQEINIKCLANVNEFNSKLKKHCLSKLSSSVFLQQVALSPPLPFVASVKINGVGCCFLELLLYLKNFFAMSLYVLYYFASGPPPAHAAPPPPSVWRSPRALLPSNCQLWLSRLWKWSPNVRPVSSGLICLKQLTLTF